MDFLKFRYCKKEDSSKLELSSLRTHVRHSILPLYFKDILQTNMIKTTYLHERASIKPKATTQVVVHLPRAYDCPTIAFGNNLPDVLLPSAETPG